jgi:hypothetical protein
VATAQLAAAVVQRAVATAQLAAAIVQRAAATAQRAPATAQRAAAIVQRAVAIVQCVGVVVQRASRSAIATSTNPSTLPLINICPPVRVELRALRMALFPKLDVSCGLFDHFVLHVLSALAIEANNAHHVSIGGGALV